MTIVPNYGPVTVVPYRPNLRHPSSVWRFRKLMGCLAIIVLLRGACAIPRLGATRHTGRPARHIYIVDQDNYRIVRIDDMTGKNWQSFGQHSHGTEEFDQFISVGPIFVDNQDRIYMLQNPGVCRMDDISGKNWIGLSAYTHKLGRCLAFCANHLGRVYLLTEGYNDTTDTTMLVRFDDMTGKNPVVYGGSTGSGRGHFNLPSALYVDAQDRIYIADSLNNCIIRIDDMTGKNWTQFGTYGRGSGQFDGPISISMDRHGRIYVMDTHRLVRMDDMTGKNWTLFQERPDEKEDKAYTVWLDDQDRIYLSYARLGVVRVDDITGKNWIAFKSTPQNKLGGVTAVCVW